MSEKPEKNLEETRLDPKETKRSPGASTPNPNDDVTTVSEVIPLQPTSPPGPGILTVTLHQALGLSIGERSEPIFFSDPDVCQRWLIYAVLEYENFQVSTEAICCRWGRRNTSVMWPGVYPMFPGDRTSTAKFDVSTPSELTVHLSDKKFDAPNGHQVTLLGLIRVNPFKESWVPGEQWVDVRDGIGRVRLEFSYLEKKVASLEDRNLWRIFEEDRCGDLVIVKKEDTGRSYAMKTVSTPHAVLGSETVRSLHSLVEPPFIAPVKFAFKSPKGLNFLSPLASGGHLFVYLQKERRFEADKAIFYAAELVCALEYLHDNNVILTHLGPEHIFLDAFGHVSLCDPGLFGLETKGGDRYVPNTPNFAAPELLLGQEASPTVDWWTLGIILCEMLTGRLPFYHENADELRHRVIDRALQLPEGLSLGAKDILCRLLDKDPAKRLGAKGASEIKAHEFFRNIDWRELTQQRYESPFKPDDTPMVFRMEPKQRQEYQFFRETEVRRMSQGILYIELVFPGPSGGSTFWDRVRTDKGESNSPGKGSSSPEEHDAWELVWTPTAREFLFNNRLTGENRPSVVKLRAFYRRDDPTVQGECDPVTQSPLPSQSQKMDALAVALEAGFSNHVVSQILGYGMDLNGAVLDYVQRPELRIVWPPAVDRTSVTPLEWAVEHENLELVQLFLDNGAEANFSVERRQGPALPKAARRRNQKLVEMLVSRTNRVNSTRAFALAVEHQDTTTASTLLANGVLPDFEESDRPHAVFDADACDFTDGPPGLEEEDFTPPLVRAVRLGNADLVRLLLAHGANANVGYHVLGGHDSQHFVDCVDRRIPASFSCGRPAQLAMELGHPEVVQLLLDGGADISLPPPVWAVQEHTCPLAPWSVYVRVVAGLEEAAAARRAHKAAPAG